MADRRRESVSVATAATAASSSAPDVAMATSRSEARVASLGIGIGLSDAAQHGRVDGPRDGRSPDAGVRVRFSQDGQLSRVLQLANCLQSNGGVSVLPAGVGLELVQESHGRNGCVRKIRAGTARG
jgi:hypothetical protein